MQNIQGKHTKLIQGLKEMDRNQFLTLIKYRLVERIFFEKLMNF